MGLGNDTLCGFRIETRMADAVCETFTTLYHPLGGIGSSAMTVADKEGSIETPLFNGLAVCAAKETIPGLPRTGV